MLQCDRPESATYRHSSSLDVIVLNVRFPYVSRREDGHDRGRANTRQGMASVREEANVVSPIPKDPAVPLAVALGLADRRPAAVARHVDPNVRGSLDDPRADRTNP